MKRRSFLQQTAVAAGASALCWFSGHPLQAAGPVIRRKSKDNRILVVIFQRGAMDGLMAVPPLADRYLAQHRPNLVMKPGSGQNAVVDLTGRFGLHPAFAPWVPLFQKEKKLAIVHGVGLPNAVRSHFDAQAFMENGNPQRKGGDGWLNRLLAQLEENRSPFRAVAMDATLPLSLYGNTPALAIENLQQFGRVSAESQLVADRYSLAAQSLLGESADQSRATFQKMAGADWDRFKSGDEITYPRGATGKGLQQVAQLIKANVGLRVACVDSSGWDTHARQGNQLGPFARAARELAGSVEAFWQDLGAHRDKVLVMTMTEFGRTVAENGSAGTDHGRASCFFLLGERVRGGRVYGDVPMLSRANLEEGRDLPVTTDYREVLAEVSGKHLGVGVTRGIFPNWRGKPMRLMRS